MEQAALQDDPEERVETRLANTDLQVGPVGICT